MDATLLIGAVSVLCTVIGILSRTLYRSLERHINAQDRLIQAMSKRIDYLQSVIVKHGIDVPDFNLHPLDSDTERMRWNDPERDSGNNSP